MPKLTNLARFAVLCFFVQNMSLCYPNLEYWYKNSSTNKPRTPYESSFVQARITLPVILLVVHCIGIDVSLYDALLLTLILRREYQRQAGENGHIESRLIITSKYFK